MSIMADYKVDISRLPEDVREKLAELDLELSEGKCYIFLFLSIKSIYCISELFQVIIVFKQWSFVEI